jgi:hypothetical protein
MVLGPTANLAAKAKEDRSMPIKWDVPEDVYGAVLRGPRDMARARLLQSQFQTGYFPPHRYNVRHRCRCMRGPAHAIPALSAQRARTNEVYQGMSGMPTSRYHVLQRRTVGSPTGREPYGDRASIVVRGWESHPHGEGRQVVWTLSTERYARCAQPTLF